jgi:hypothetical protein
LPPPVTGPLFLFSLKEIMKIKKQQTTMCIFYVAFIKTYGYQKFIHIFITAKHAKAKTYT